MTIDPQRAQALFLAALELSDSAARRALLNRECANDDALRQRVDALLQAHDAAGGFGDDPTGQDFQATIDSSANIRSATMVGGRYKLIEAIGEGGMGTVWLAEQKEPVKRRVAIKLVKPGMDSRAVLARFEAERQALAMMDHPNIARVLDGGATEQGRPYFAMELVRGIAITDYCDQAQLSIRERLALFGQVCSAVQHAHQKGIIHRDLKPTNILVTEHDGRPVVKVIDFGLAKALHGTHTLTDLSMNTSFGAVLGTPLYMAPEQLGTSALDIDTRADMYSLGVILYELLTGSTPIERERLKEAAWDEIRRIVREEDPPRPSTRLSSSGSLPSLAARRHVEPTKLTRLVRGELDWIIMKSLEKDRNRRYESASSLGQDVQRYLDNEPVQAAPPSRLYRLRKLVRRHRGPVMAACLVAAALVAGLAGTMYGLVRANDSAAEARDKQRIAEAAQASAEQAAERERAATLQTEKRLVQIEKGLELFGEMLIDINPRVEEQGGDSLYVQLRKRAEKAADELKTESVGDPLAEARLLTILGRTLNSLGSFEKARQVLERAHLVRSQELGANHPDTLDSLNMLAVVHREAGRIGEAVALFEKVLKGMGDQPVAGNYDLVDKLNSTAVTYLAVGEFSRAIEIFKQIGDEYEKTRGADDPLTLIIRHNLGDAYQDAGRIQEAIELLEQVRVGQQKVHGENHVLTLYTLQSLAGAYRDVGRLPEAIELLEQVRDEREKKLGGNHPETLTTFNNLGSAYRAAGRLPEAIVILERARDGFLRNVGTDHHFTLSTLCNLAAAYQDDGRLAEAIAILENVRDIEARRPDVNRADSLKALSQLAGAYLPAKRISEAIDILEDVREQSTEILGANHPDTLSARFWLAQAYRADGRLADAIALLEQLRDTNPQTKGVDQRMTASTLDALADAYQADGRHAEAIAILEQKWEASQKTRGGRDPETLMALNNLAYAYRAAGKPELALPLFEKAFEIRKESAGMEDPVTLRYLQNLAATYWSLQRLDRSIPLFEEALRLQENTNGKDHRMTLSTRGNLGVNYRDAGRLDEAIELLEGVNAASSRYPELQFFRGELLLAYANSGQPSEKAKQLATTMLADVRRDVVKDSPQLAGSLASIGSAMLQFQAFADAEPLLRECLKIRERAIPDSWPTWNTKSMLGEALLGQDMYLEAEPLLLAGYSGLKERRQTIPAEARIRLKDAIRRLVNLYTAMDKPEEVKRWQDELDQDSAIE